MADNVKEGFIDDVGNKIRKGLGLKKNYVNPQFAYPQATTHTKKVARKELANKIKNKEYIPFKEIQIYMGSRLIWEYDIGEEELAFKFAQNFANKTERETRVYYYIETANDAGYVLDLIKSCTPEEGKIDIGYMLDYEIEPTKDQYIKA